MTKKLILPIAIASIAQLNAANLIVNGSFETRTSPAPPTSGFSSGIPDSWTEILFLTNTNGELVSGRPYLVHESNGTVPGNNAIDGEIIVGGNQSIILSQTFTTVNTAPLEISWWANNEFVESAGNNTLHDSAVQFNTLGGDLIEWTEYRDSSNPTDFTWVNHTFTTSTVFSPGTYEVRFFIGGRTSADDLVITQIPEPSGLSLLALAALGFTARRRR